MIQLNTMLSHLLDYPISILPSWYNQDRNPQTELERLRTRLEALGALPPDKGSDPTLAHPAGIRPQIYHLRATVAAKRSLDLKSWSNTYQIVKVSFYAYAETPTKGLLRRQSSSLESSRRAFVVFDCLFPPDPQPFLVRLERRDIDSCRYSFSTPGSGSSDDEDELTTPSSAFLERCTLLQSFVPQKNMSILDLAVLACVVNEYEPYPTLSPDEGQWIWFAYVVYRVSWLQFGTVPGEGISSSNSKKCKRKSLSGGRDPLLAVMKGKQKPERLPGSASGIWKGMSGLSGPDTEVGRVGRDCDQLRTTFQERIREESRDISNTIKSELSAKSRAQKSLQAREKLQRELNRLADERRDLDDEVARQSAAEEWMEVYEARMSGMIKEWGRFKGVHEDKKRKVEERIEVIEARLSDRMMELNVVV
ncbi:hypothetical protein BKA70DRAFT_721889 [Coprinopsis sp. MPI-PUGE-AT-0042]|nr:hypothetical protein BKA70DRAFT_721889 [Coprinopsis sp. MPI-PUGE-AT-0042]